MLRLRTTVGLSLLALAVGVAGTAWLSALTDDWAGPPARTVSHVDKVRAVLRRRTSHVPADDNHVPALAAAMPTSVHAASAMPSLTPIDMPSPSASFFRRAVPMRGRVVLHLDVDGAGRVTQATVGQSSGDATLDDRAVQTVLGWRFAVPSDRPDGLEGSLVMRFDDGADRVPPAP